MAKVKKSVKNSQFPQILRKIPAWFSWRLVITVLIVSLLFLQLAQLAKTLSERYQETQFTQAEKRMLEGQIALWERVVAQRPNYRDASFELAVLTYRLNRIDETKKHLQKVFELDPNFEPARKLETTIQKK